MMAHGVRHCSIIMTVLPRRWRQIVALREADGGNRDERRVKRGEAALWKLVSQLGRDDSDTVGFPIIAASLAQDAAALGLDVPQPPMRYAAAYNRKVQKLLALPHRDWRTNSLSFSLEGTVARGR